MIMVINYRFGFGVIVAFVVSNEVQEEAGLLCKFCGNPVHKGFIYCPYCGKKL